MERDWWIGTVDERTGWFPSAFVTVPQQFVIIYRMGILKEEALYYWRGRCSPYNIEWEALFYWRVGFAKLKPASNLTILFGFSRTEDFRYSRFIVNFIPMTVSHMLPPGDEISLYLFCYYYFVIYEMRYLNMRYVIKTLITICNLIETLITMCNIIGRIWDTDYNMKCN